MIPPSKALAISIVCIWILALLAFTSTVLISFSTTFGFPLPFARQIYAEPGEVASYKEIEFYPLSIVALCIASMLVGAVASRIWNRHSSSTDSSSQHL
jgi:hypothetical protein